ncbi:hypothetical protein [Nitrincola sp. MINF-07-Sa-05]|uniref:hypothetical protein n=1 Tax=Nitrincola salilacus TaxID=3400273 RepID=UPI003917C0FC
MSRVKVLTDLLEFSKPIGMLSDNLSTLDWDYEGAPLIIYSSQVKNVIERFFSGEITAKELEEWANLIECREDLDFEDEKREELENVINCLANPALEGEISDASCKKLYFTLG